MPDLLYPACAALDADFTISYLGLAVLSMHQKEEFVFPPVSYNQRNLSKKHSSALNAEVKE